MQKAQSRSFSYDIKSSTTGTARLNVSNTNENSNNSQKRSSSFQKNLIQSKLPLIKIKKVMRKIGAVQKPNGTYIPSDAQIGQFRKSKWQQLRDQFVKRKGNKQPFEYQLDQIVLDCWDYGQSYGRKTVWKKYKQNFDQLTFDTLKVVKKKKL